MSWTSIRRASFASNELAARIAARVPAAASRPPTQGMLRYVIRRLLTAIPTLFVIVTISFFLMRVAPGGPFNQERASIPVVKANLERIYQLDEPLWQQYLHYLGDLLQRQFRPELQSSRLHRRRTVREWPAGFDPAWLDRAAAGARRRRRAWHHRGAVPEPSRRLCRDRPCHRRQHHSEFRHRATLSALFAPDPQSGCRSAAGAAALRQQDRPGVTLALPQIAVVARLMRGSMIEALRSHHIRTARALGLSDATSSSNMRCAARFCRSFPMPGPPRPALLTGSIIVEIDFRDTRALAAISSRPRSIATIRW